MKAMHIDFAARSWRSVVRRAGLPAVLFVLAGLAACSFVAVRVWDGQAAIKLAQQQVQVLQDRQAVLARRQALAVPAVSIISQAQERAVNRAIAELNLPWRDLWDAVEVATPENIAILSLDPEANAHLLRGVAEAKDAEAMIAYIAQLKRQALFDSVLLTKHEKVEQDPNRPLRFQFEARWKGAQP